MKLFPFCLILSLIFSILKPAHAQTQISSSKDWSLWETTVAGVTTCYMRSEDKKGLRAENFYMDLVKQKNKVNSPLEVYIRIEKNKQGASGALGSFNSSSTMTFSDLDGNKNTLWGVGKNLSGLMNQLAATNDSAQFVTTGGSKQLDFKMKAGGFTAMMNEMSARCNMGQPLVRKNFEAQLFANVASSIAANKLNVTKTTQLRNFYFKAYSIDTLKLNAQDELKVVLAKYQTFIDEREQLNKELLQIQNIDLPQSKSTLATAQQTQINMRSEIPKLESAIATQTQQVQASQQSYNSAKALLAPLEPEYNRINQSINSAQQSLQSAKTRLQQIDSRLSTTNSLLVQLNNEYNFISQNLPQKRSELNRADSAARDAEYTRRNFDTRSEKQKALDRNPEYGNLVRQKQAIESGLPQLKNEREQNIRERSRIEKELSECTADCEKYTEALEISNKLISDQTTEINGLESDLSSAKSRMNTIEIQTEREIQRYYNDLVSKEQDARNRYNSIYKDVQNDENRLSQLRNTEIPQLQNEKNSLQNERPNVLNQISIQQQNVQRYTNELNQFKVANDWDRKANDVSQKSNILNADQSKLSQLKSQKQNAESTLATAIQTETQMKTRIAGLNQRVLSINTRTAELDLKLKDLPAERAPIDQKIANLETEFNIQKQGFLTTLQ